MNKHFFRMLMVWKNLLLKSYACITVKSSTWNSVLPDSITFTDHKVPGKEDGKLFLSALVSSPPSATIDPKITLLLLSLVKKLQPLSVEKLFALQKNLKCGVMENKLVLFV